MTNTPQTGRLAFSIVAMVLVVALLAWAILWQRGAFRDERAWTISTGFEGGTYATLGARLATSLTDALPNETFSVADSAGSTENVRRVADGSADFAFVQSDVALPHNVRLVARLYDELVHVLVAEESPMRNFAQLENARRMSLGPHESGTRGVAARLLAHFQVDLREEGQAAIAPNELGDAFARDEIDAAFVLAGAGSKIVDALLDARIARLVPIGATDEIIDGGGPHDAFALLHPEFEASVIPTALYGAQPLRPTPTVSVSAMLVTRESVDNALVRAVADHVHTNRHDLAADLGIPLRLDDRADLPTSPIPYHEGAAAYHLREEPSFLVEYAEAISLVLTLLVGAWSLGTLFVRWRSDLKKERIDEFYEIVRASEQLAPEERLTDLRATYRRAFDDLMAERLAPNESFTIFQSYLMGEIARAESELEPES